MHGIDDTKRSNALRKLTGWKSISRHLGRSERTVQFWELERSLPVHRIPGGRGQTVYAYAEELDAWMAQGKSRSTPDPSAAQSSIHHATLMMAGASPPTIRPPGILVLPFENHETDTTSRFGDAICQRLIARLAEAQHSVRVLSWQTAKCVRHGVDTLESMGASLQVRYLVEGSVNCTASTKHVDVRIIDADLDQVVLADRFVARPENNPSFQDEVAEAIALHFALIHEGALVEPICSTETTPTTFLDYLSGARSFFEGSSSLSDALISLERALSRDESFMPARALQGLVLLQAAGDAPNRAACAVRVRTIASVCNASNSARVTAAFLDAAIAIACDKDWKQAERRLAKEMHWLPPALASHRRLYERRSPRRPRPEAPLFDGRNGSRSTSESGDAADAANDLFGALMTLLWRVNLRDGAGKASPSFDRRFATGHHGTPEAPLRHDASSIGRAKPTALSTSPPFAALNTALHQVDKRG